MTEKEAKTSLSVKFYKTELGQNFRLFHFHESRGGHVDFRIILILLGHAAAHEQVTVFSLHCEEKP